jgi:hypothetical protein
MRTLLVSGYVEIAGHPRPRIFYETMGRELEKISGPKVIFRDTLRDCWMFKYNYNGMANLTFAIGDNPRKNSPEYHTVQYQKTEWLVRAAVEHPEADMFVWMDYGIFYLPEVTGVKVSEFLQQVRDDEITIPGCFPSAGEPPSHTSPHWRFCGTVLAVPRKYVFAFDQAVKIQVTQQAALTHIIDWEVNSWARAEFANPLLPIYWYAADHNATMLTNYRG